MKTAESKEAFRYEFGGPLGTSAIVVFLPLIVLLLGHWAHVGHVDLSFAQDFVDLPFWQAMYKSDIFCPSCAADPMRLVYCALGLLGWFVYLVVLERCLPCTLAQGRPVLNTGSPLTYRINGHLSLWVTLLMVTVGWPTWDAEHQVWQLGSAPLDVLLYDNFAPLALAAIGWTLFLSICLYMASFRPNTILASGGNSGNALYDFFVGRELNPRPLQSILPNFDWKEFCELRPGLILWMLLNVANAQAQKRELGYISGSMILVNLFQGIYVWDGLYNESAILTTMDITTDGFGFMLAFGDMAWVPFTYCIQSRFLVLHDPQLSVWALTAIGLLHILGFCIFRGANGQKDKFRSDPNQPSVQHLQFLQTKRGTKLLTSGWWGYARKINYTGDWLMGLTWCLVGGFHSLVPYYYAIYFAVLLVHRASRDDEMCHAKYGDDWLEYKRRVPYKFIPGIF